MSHEELLSEIPKPLPPKSYPPWSEAQVANLVKRQEDVNRHQYTCGTKEKHNSPIADTALVPDTDGWHCPTCDYTQDWCHLADTRTPFQNTVEFVVKHHEVELTDKERELYDKLLD